MWIALFVTWALGVATVRLIFRGWRISLALWLLFAVLGLGSGYALLAAARYWGFLAGITSSSGWTLLELVAVAGIGLFSLLASKPRDLRMLLPQPPAEEAESRPRPPNRPSRTPKSLHPRANSLENSEPLSLSTATAAEMCVKDSNVIFVVLLSIAVVVQSSVLAFCFERAFEGTPHGMWDAFGFWNTKARMLFLAGEHWPEAFNAAIPHPDYPPFLPLTVVRFWEWQQDASTFVPFFTSIAFSALNSLLLLAVLGVTRNVTQGLLAMLVLGSSEIFARWGAAQYADIQLAFYYLAATSCALMALQPAAAIKPWLGMLGLMLGAAALTKNEGLPLMIIGLSLASGALLWKRRWLDWRALISGALPLIATLVAFKLHVRENNDLFERPISAAWMQIFVAERHLMILRAMYAMFTTDWGPWLIALGVLGGCRRAGIGGFGVLALVLPLVGILIMYYLIYLITPHDLSWHLGTSIDRLALQVWPTTLLLFFYFLRTPEEMLAKAKEEAR